MLSKEYLLIKLIGLLQFFSSCEEKGNSSSSYVKELNTSDTFLFDFPFREYEGNKDSSLYKWMSHYDSLIQIQSLYNGFDSIQIRVWLSDIYNDTTHLFIFKNENGLWNGNFLTLVDRWDKDNKKIVSVHKISQPIEPNSGSKRFINSVFKLNVLSLPDDSKIEGWKHGLYSHDTRPTFEVATKNVYRLYGYSGLDTIQNNLLQGKNVCSILGLLKSEFKFTPLTNYCFSDILGE